MGIHRMATTINKVTINKATSNKVTINQVVMTNRLNLKEMVITMSSMYLHLAVQGYSNDDIENTIMPGNRVHTHKKMAIIMRTEEVRSHLNNLMREMLKKN